MRRFLLERRFSVCDGLLISLVFYVGAILGNAKVGAGWAALGIIGTGVAVLLIRSIVTYPEWGPEEPEDRRIFSSNASDVVRLQIDQSDNVFADCSACGWRVDLNEAKVSDLIDAAQRHREGCTEST